VFGAIHEGDPDSKLLAYQYLQMLPKIADGASNKLWIIPTELTEALKGITSGFMSGRAPASPDAPTAAAPTTPPAPTPQASTPPASTLPPTR
jgi:hypothetical protein